MQTDREKRFWVDKLNKYKIIILLSFLFLSAEGVFAFVTFPEAVLTSDKTEITTGESIQADIELFVPDFVNLLQTEDDVSIPGWDIQELIIRKDLTEEGKYKVKLKITTFDGRIKEIPPVRFSYVNKDDAAGIERKVFYFFSNSLPVSVKNIFKDSDFSEIRDIKQAKKMNIPSVYYYVALLYGLFIIFFIYRNVIIYKTEKYIKIRYSFSNREKAVKNMNKLYMKYLAADAPIREYYFELSGILNNFISDSLEIGKEVPDGELLNLIKNENNKFNKYADEILPLFEKYDSIKYTGKTDSDGREFFENFIRTRDLIEKIQI